MQALAKNRTAAGAALLLTATLAWGGMFPIADRALHHVDPFWLTSLRYVAASVIFAVLLLVVEGRPALTYSGRFWRVLALGSAARATAKIQATATEAATATRPMAAAARAGA